MTTLESIILSYLANALWQVPLLFAAGWLAARVIRKIGSAAEHRVWVSVLLLQAFLPGTSTIPLETIHSFFNFFGGPQSPDQLHVSIVMGPGTTLIDPHFPTWLLACVSIVYSAITAWFVVRFLWHLNSTRLLRRNTVPATLSANVAGLWSHCAEKFAVKSASLSTSSKIYGPITIGMRHKVVVLPAGILGALPNAELRTAIAHEFAHMSRNDFLKNLIYETLSLPVRFHPVLSLTRKRLTETREMVCDQLAAGLADRHQYAHSLLRLASLLVDGMPARSPHAIGIFDATSFERRVMRLTEKPIQISGLRRLTTLAVCSMIGTGICATTVALSVHVDALAAIDEHTPAQHAGAISISPEIMQNRIIHKVPPVYPEDAKKARIQGKVQLNAVISKTGEIEQLRVVSGPKELQQSSLDAVRQWIYKPYLLNGEPVEVKTTINVIYTLKK
jgi:TonB family protein